jgi:uncharacterized membrane protein YdjX (TVP38/TMEM64 family)
MEHSSTPSKRWPLAFVVGITALGFGLNAAGVIHVDAAAIVDAVRAAGPWGMFVLVALFALGTAVNLPGFVFVGAAVAIYGANVGFLVALVGAVVSVNFTFGLGRALGLGRGTVLERPWQRWLVERLDRHPVAIMAALRTLVVVSPPVSYALALTRLRHRDYALGSAVGLIVPIWVMAKGASCLL